MKEERILNVLGQVDETYIIEAAAPEKDSRKNRWIKWAVLAACLALVAGACIPLVSHLLQTEEKHQYAIQVLDKGNGGISTIDQATIGQSLQSFQSETAPKEMTISFQGKEYSGNYEESSRSMGTTAIRDTYRVPGYSRCLEFSVDSESKAPIFIYMVGQEYFEKEMDLPTISEEKIQSKAKEYASEWIQLDDFSIFQNDYREGDDTVAAVYGFRFCSMAQGVETTDFVDVLISDRGSLIYMSAPQVGWTKEHQEELKSFDVEEATEQAKMASKLTNPAVGIRRFGINEEGKVYLMVFLTGTEEETPLLLGISQE